MKHTLILAALFSLALLAPAFADEVVLKSIADIYKEKAELAGKPVKLQGKVVKVNNNIMNRNFLHLQDGSGDPALGTNDLTITSEETAGMGDTVSVTGTLAVDMDFGSGYKYPLLLEKASITKAP
ncbi:MAG: hypothetical protein KAX64_07665 [Chromatiaceae bacterium]|jgi:hypothetical protein|nr:hypothetical protein [Chromatiaceae bacterium]MBP8198421.1 hypothetical protein [Chromatiaceae bacterium]MBP8284937.1 hypothetical protein [Chromatiaceae bacterium]